MTSATPPRSSRGPALTAGPQDNSVDDVMVLGLVSAFELATFARLAADADMAPDLRGRVMLTRSAAAAVDRRERLAARLVELGADPVDAMVPFTHVLDDFDVRTPPSTWWERLLKAYIGYGVADDLCRLLAGGLGERTRGVVLSALDDAPHSDLAEAELLQGSAGDDVLMSRLGLWGRRVVGEALGVVQGLAASHPELLRLATSALGPGDDTLQKLFGQLTAEHTRRMARLGLKA
jgi:hypothetical protein